MNDQDQNERSGIGPTIFLIAVAIALLVVYEYFGLGNLGV
jgi:hypothetical protein